MAVPNRSKTARNIHQSANAVVASRSRCAFFGPHRTAAIG
jgi:hypothetical protein